MSRESVTWQDRVTVILSLLRVGEAKLEDPAALVDSPEQTWSVRVALIRPEPKHYPAYKERPNSVTALLAEVGMCVAVSSFLVLAGIWAELVGRRVEFVLGVWTIGHTR